MCTSHIKANKYQVWAKNIYLEPQEPTESYARMNVHLPLKQYLRKYTKHFI